METFTLIVWLATNAPGLSAGVAKRYEFPAASMEQCEEMREAARKVLKGQAHIECQAREQCRECLWPGMRWKRPSP